MIETILAFGLPPLVGLVVWLFMRGTDTTQTAYDGQNTALTTLVDSQKNANTALVAALTTSNERFDKGLQAVAGEMKADREFHRTELSRLSEHVVKIEKDVHQIREDVADHVKHDDAFHKMLAEKANERT